MLYNGATFTIYTSIRSFQGVHKNGNYGRVVDSQYVAHDITSFITETAFMRIPTSALKESCSPRQGAQIYLYTWWPRMTLSKLCSASCCHVLHLPDVHARVDTFDAYNGMVRGYMENLVIRIIYRHMRLRSGLYGILEHCTL